MGVRNGQRVCLQSNAGPKSTSSYSSIIMLCSHKVCAPLNSSGLLVLLHSVPMLPRARSVSRQCCQGCRGTPDHLCHCTWKHLRCVPPVPSIITSQALALFRYTSTHARTHARTHVDMHACTQERMHARTHG